MHLEPCAKTLSASYIVNALASLLNRNEMNMDFAYTTNSICDLKLCMKLCSPVPSQIICKCKLHVNENYAVFTKFD